MSYDIRDNKPNKLLPGVINRLNASGIHVNKNTYIIYNTLAG